MAVDASTKPTLAEYAADLAKRMEKSLPGNATILAVGILGFAAEDERLDEHERAMSKAWLDRLVDDEGNQLDEKGRDAMQWASEENTLGQHGTLSSITREDDRVTLTIVVSRRAATLDRDEVRAKLVPHAESYVDHLLDALYSELNA